MSFRRGFLQNMLLIVFSTLLLPVATLVALVSWIISRFTPTAKHISHHRTWRASSSSMFRPRIVLVTGMATTEGLALARAFYRAGHKVIGLDSESSFIPAFGRFSHSLEKSYSLSSTGGNFDSYSQKIVNIVNKHGIELLVTCCSKKDTVLYAHVAAFVERSTACKAIQFKSVLTQNLLKPDYFFEESMSLGLNVSEMHVNGPMYHTHSLIIHGKVLAFVAYRAPTAGTTTAYKSLPHTSAISMAMLECTQVYAKEFGKGEAGQLSLEFVLDIDDLEPDLRKKLYPVECSPTISTAVLLFAQDSEDLAEIYLSILSDHEPKAALGGRRSGEVVIPESLIRVYCLGDDIKYLVVIPFIDFIRKKLDIWNFLALWAEFLEHILFWNEAMFEVWDPWPAWAFYSVYQPATTLVELFRRASR